MSSGDSDDGQVPRSAPQRRNVRAIKGSRHSIGEFEVTSSSEEEHVRLAVCQSPCVICMARLRHLLFDSSGAEMDCICHANVTHIRVSHPYSCSPRSQSSTSWCVPSVCIDSSKAAQNGSLFTPYACHCRNLKSWGPVGLQGVIQSGRRASAPTGAWGLTR